MIYDINVEKSRENMFTLIKYHEKAHSSIPLVHVCIFPRELSALSGSDVRLARYPLWLLHCVYATKWKSTSKLDNTAY